MLNKNEIDLINHISDAVGKSAEYVTDQYTHWNMLNSIGWLTLGIVVCLGAFFAPLKDDDTPQIAVYIVKGVVIFLGLLFVAANISDIINPTATAIHYLLKDIRGS